MCVFGGEGDRDMTPRCRVSVASSAEPPAVKTHLSYTARPPSRRSALRFVRVLLSPDSFCVSPEAAWMALDRPKRWCDWRRRQAVS